LRLIAASNAFKGSLSALQASRAMALGARDLFREASIEIVPVSDGGDGFLDVMRALRGGRVAKVSVSGPLGSLIRAPLLLKEHAAYIEMALASGLALLKKSRNQPDALNASSRGTGLLIRAALDRGAKEIVVGLGGSATNDGGAGMAQALGFKLLDAKGRELESGAAPLRALARILPPELRLLRRIEAAHFVGVSDVENPLLGARGSARTFGPQKGATPAQVRLIEMGLSRLARVAGRDLGRQVAGKPGAGAAGGLGFGLMAFLGAKMLPGSAWILKASGLPRLLRNADAVLTGEGRLDKTSFHGKAPLTLARAAQDRGIPVAIVCGSLDEAVRARLSGSGVGAVATLTEVAEKEADLFRRAPLLCRKAASLALKRLILA
jgi:glycerate kinase